MKKIKWIVTACIVVALIITGAASAPAAGATRTIVDMAGRTRDVPVEINSVFATNPMAVIFLYCLAPDKLAGLSSPINKRDKRFVIDSYKALPVLGGSFGGRTNTTNLEGILKAKVQIVLAIGDLDELAISEADKFERQIGLPVIIADGNIENTAKTYEFLGELLNEKARARELAEYCENVLNNAKQIAASIPEPERRRIYYAEGASGLETDPKGSRHSEVIDLVGGINVAEAQVMRGYGRTKVSLEQVLVWNPDVILVCTDSGLTIGGYFDKIYKDPSWASMKAIQNKEVYEVPYSPFNWFDRPPSTNRIIGVKWLGNLLYPDHFKLDIKKEMKEFYEKFYHRKLTDDETDEILANSVKVN